MGDVAMKVRYFGTRGRLNTPMYHLPELQGRLEGYPSEIEKIEALHGVNPVHQGKDCGLFTKK